MPSIRNPRPNRQLSVRTLVAIALLLAVGDLSAEPLPSFDRLDLRGAVDVTIERSDRPGVQILSQQHLAARTEIEVSDGVLYVTAPKGEKIMLAVQTPLLEEVLVRGEATVRADRVTGSQLVLDSRGTSAFDIRSVQVGELAMVGSGAAVFRVSGHAERQIIDLDGTGQVDAQNLVSRSSEVRVRGAGDVYLQAREHLAVDVAGAAKVTYFGSPVVARNIRGVGIVRAVR